MQINHPPCSSQSPISARKPREKCANEKSHSGRKALSLSGSEKKLADASSTEECQLQPLCQKLARLRRKLARAHERAMRVQISCCDDREEIHFVWLPTLRCFKCFNYLRFSDPILIGVIEWTGVGG